MIIFENEVGHVYINLVHVIWKRPIENGTKRHSDLQRPFRTFRLRLHLLKESSLLNRISSCYQTVSIENGAKVIKRFKNRSQFQMYRSSDRWREEARLGYI